MIEMQNGIMSAQVVGVVKAVDLAKTAMTLKAYLNTIK